MERSESYCCINVTARSDWLPWVPFESDQGFACGSWTWTSFSTSLVGKATISNDGATILKLLDVVHPAAKTLVDIAKSQDAEVGERPDCAQKRKTQQRELVPISDCEDFVGFPISSGSPGVVLKCSVCFWSVWMTQYFLSVQVGDGTTSVTLLAAEFLKQVKPYVEEGLHPQIIIRAFRTATQLVRQQCS